MMKGTNEVQPELQLVHSEPSSSTLFRGSTPPGFPPPGFITICVPANSPLATPLDHLSPPMTIPSPPSPPFIHHCQIWRFPTQLGGLVLNLWAKIALK